MVVLKGSSSQTSLTPQTEESAVWATFIGRPGLSVESSSTEVTNGLGEAHPNRDEFMNRRILVGVLISLAVSNVFGVLFAVGVLSLTPDNSNFITTMTLNETTILTASMSTTVTRGTLHHHYTEDLTISLGGCADSSQTG
ncbi:MAG TPA: hypothetical protein VE955_00360, partial [Candidatus Dormibacteraeota bacterium]|nr:hypothetical protein [Candidatus Dormibacteraeota bacterium]